MNPKNIYHLCNMYTFKYYHVSLPTFLWNYTTEKQIARPALRNKKNRYSRRIYFISDKKQLDSLPSINGGSNFVSVLNGEKRIINSKNSTRTNITVLSEWMTYSYISLQMLPEKGSLGIHYFISKHGCYFEPLRYVISGWAVLDIFSNLLIKSDLHSRRFASLCNSDILFHKISDNPILHSSN